MTINYIPLYANGQLSTDDFNLIQKRLELSAAVIRKVPSFYDLQDVDVLVRADNRMRCLPVSGRAWDSHTVIITVNPNQDEYYKNPEKDDLSKSLAHEFHHILRWRFIRYEKAMLSEDLVLEGLAQCFELETGHSESRYAKNLTKAELLEISERARTFILAGQENYNYQQWFHGNEADKDAEERYKRWGGYSLGFAVVASWLSDGIVNGGYDTAGKAVHLSTDTVLKPWLEKGKEVLIPWLKTTRGFPPDRPGFQFPFNQPTNRCE